jgi:hypothetical protein
MFSTFQLIDSDGCIYDELDDLNYSMWRSAQGFGSRSDDYYPGEIRQDIAAFRVSPTAENLTLKWKGKTINLYNIEFDSTIKFAGNNRLNEPSNSSNLISSNKTKKIDQLIEKMPAEASGRRIEVLKVSETQSLSTEMGDSIKGRIILVLMNLSNTSKQTGNFMFSTFQLIDSDGCIYDELDDLNYIMWRSAQGFGSRSDDYYPGEVRQDIAAFRVAPNAQNFSLQWKGNTINLEI